jgi:hypothetical protein
MTIANNTNNRGNAEWQSLCAPHETRGFRGPQRSRESEDFEIHLGDSARAFCQSLPTMTATAQRNAVGHVEGCATVAQLNHVVGEQAR